MKRIPHSEGVIKALRSVRAAAQKSLKGLNVAASQRMARGDYATAEILAAQGKEIQQFESEVEALRKRWREVCGAEGREEKRPTTPLWAYYQPILQGLVQAGGECRRTDLEAHVERLMSASLKPGDSVPTARGRERWRVMVRRARKPLIAEGWIEDGSGKVWENHGRGPAGGGTAERQGSARAQIGRRRTTMPVNVGKRFYTGAVPWHGLAVNLAQLATLAKALKVRG